ncbi:MAG: S24 family peptidase [Flavobacteriales bacterium]
MSTLSENLKRLRAKETLSQQAIADILTITRGAYQKYEEGKSEPPHSTLIKLSNYYSITIDILLQIDLRKTNPEDLMKLNNRMLFPVMTSKKEKQPIELISKSAQAGYALGYGDPEFIQSLKTMSLPFLGVGKFRAFPIAGDSMLPNVKDGSYVIGEYVEHLTQVKNGKTYIVLTKDDGIVYKRVNQGVRSIELISDNKYYDPYTVSLHEIIELWEFKAAINVEDSQPEEVTNEQILETIMSMKGGMGR